MFLVPQLHVDKLAQGKVQIRDAQPKRAAMRAMAAAIGYPKSHYRPNNQRESANVQAPNFVAGQDDGCDSSHGQIDQTNVANVYHSVITNPKQAN